MGGNALTELLRSKGHVGEKNALGRREAAAYLRCTVREVQRLSQLSRESKNIGDDVVFYTSAGKRKGLFVPAQVDDIDALDKAIRKIRRECITRYRQYRALKHRKELLAKNTVVEAPVDARTLKQNDMFGTKVG